MDEEKVLETVGVVSEVVKTGLDLIDEGLALIRANHAGDAEAEKQAILRANRIASDALAKHQAES